MALVLTLALLAPTLLLLAAPAQGDCHGTVIGCWWFDAGGSVQGSAAFQAGNVVAVAAVFSASAQASTNGTVQVQAGSEGEIVVHLLPLPVSGQDTNRTVSVLVVTDVRDAPLSFVDGNATRVDLDLSGDGPVVVRFPFVVDDDAGTGRVPLAVGASVDGQTGSATLDTFTASTLAGAPAPATGPSLLWPLIAFAALFVGAAIGYALGGRARQP